MTQSVFTTGQETLPSDQHNIGPTTFNNVNTANSTTRLKVFYTNADSLSNKYLELLTTIDFQSPDLLCITETLPKNSLYYTPFDLDSYGYTSYHSCVGRGVSVYVKNCWSSEQIHLNVEYTESIWVRVSCSNNTCFTIGTVYRSPNSTQENNQALIQLVEEATKIQSNSLICVGDFNMKEIDWVHNKVNCSQTHPAWSLYDKLNDLFISQLVLEPTRYREGETHNLLDWVLTDTPDRIDKIQIGPPLGSNGDHCTISFEFVVSFEQIDQGGYLCFNKGNYTELRNILSIVDWHAMLDQCDIENAWNTFQNTVTQAIEKCVPRFKPRARKSPPWIDKDARTCIRERNKAWSVYRKNKSEENWSNYKSIRNETGRKLTKSKVNYENNLASKIKENPKLFWNYVKLSSGGKKDIPAIKDDLGRSITNDQEKVEIFNNYFCDVYTIEDLTNIPTPSPTNNPNYLNECHVSQERVTKQLKKLNISKAAGPDNLHSKILVETHDLLALPLTIIYSKSLQENKLPTKWKEAHIKPLYKKGSKNSASNYRPVSLTSVCCKTLERLIREDLMTFLENNNLISNQQHGFRSGRSCCTQLLELMEIWSELSDKGEAWDCIYLDFAKAFDRVPHRRLISKLRCLGINGNLLAWIDDFLTNRKQAVTINNVISNQRHVTSGIPQGSVLGPILFIVYINDLPDQIKSFIKIFADDTKLFNTIANLRDISAIQQDLDALYNWSVKWQLGFNATKCKVIHYGSNNMEANYYLNGILLESTSKERDLGVIFDDKLKFSEHIGAITAKANSRLGIIKRTFSNLTPAIFVPLYKTLVRPLLEYCSPIWSPILKKDSIEIEKVQRRATKLVKQIVNLDYNERLHFLKLDSLHFRRRRTDLIQVFKIIKGIDNIDHNIFFEISHNTHTRGHSLKLFKKQSNCNLRKQVFSQRVINDWNSLKESTVQCKTVDSFKSALKKEWAHHPDRYDMP